MTRVPMVVYDQPSDAIHAIEVPPGTTVAALLDHLQVAWAVREVFAGSPLRQLKADATDVLGVGELTLFAAPPQPHAAVMPCIRLRLVSGGMSDAL